MQGSNVRFSLDMLKKLRVIRKKEKGRFQLIYDVVDVQEKEERAQDTALRNFAENSLLTR